MAKATITEILLLLARARTQQQRIYALREASLSPRFDCDQITELRSLIAEAQSQREEFKALRPVTTPTQECDLLSSIQPGPEPILPTAIQSELCEWVEGWNRADELLINQIALPGAMLLSGPTGTGKTMLTKSIARAMKDRPAVVLDAHRVVSSHMGDSGGNIAKAFSAAGRTNALLVIEEIDAVAEARGGDNSGASRENNRITIALLRLLEEATFPVVATTNRSSVLDPALLRRFEVKLEFMPLDECSRANVLKTILGGAPTPEMISMPFAEAVALAKKVKRQRFLATRAA